ncbi:ATP-grasp domain-containing protein [Escherichia coli]
MNISEILFARYGLPAPVGYACTTPREAEEAASKIGAGPWVVKCQVHAGGRGKAGGVKVVNSKEDIRFAENWLGKRLVTYQTDANGQPVNQILVEAATDIAKELYLGAVVDRSSRRVVFMASTEGGVEIEKVAEETPHLIHKVALDPAELARCRIRDASWRSNWVWKVNWFSSSPKIFMGSLATIFLECDLALIEINPLVITKQGDLICLDGKLALTATHCSASLICAKCVTSRRRFARSTGCTVGTDDVALDGNIGCMVNGAGLATGTMDIVKLHGGER